MAVWLWLARWASEAVTKRNLAFICNSGHEYDDARCVHAPAVAATVTAFQALVRRLTA